MAAAAAAAAEPGGRSASNTAAAAVAAAVAAADGPAALRKQLKEFTLNTQLELERKLKVSSCCTPEAAMVCKVWHAAFHVCKQLYGCHCR
jgi:hypothetical protein